jgi:hypothetical protein
MIAIDEYAVTVWKEGCWKVWHESDAKYAETDWDWLATIPLRDAILDALSGGTDSRQGTK